MKGLRRVVSACFALALVCGLSACAFSPKTYEPSDDKYFTYTALEDGTFAVSAATDVQLPETLSLPVSHEGAKVTQVAANGFKTASVIKVRIPQNIKTIGANAFYGSASLKEIYFYDGLETICESAFAYCPALTAAELPATVKTLEKGAFSYDGALSKFLSPASLTDIGSFCFYSCAALSDVYISASVKTIGESAFDKCSAQIVFRISAQNTVFTLADGKPVKK